MRVLASALLICACGTAVGQGTEYNPPNDLPIGEPTDRSQDDAGTSDADATD